MANHQQEEIGKKDHTRTDRGDDPRIVESRLFYREFGPSELFRESLYNLKHHCLAVLVIGHQHHAVSLLVCEEERQESRIRPRVRKIPIRAMSIDSKTESIVSS